MFVINKADHAGAGEARERRFVRRRRWRRSTIEVRTAAIVKTVATEAKGVREAIEALSEAHARVNRAPAAGGSLARERLVRELVRERLLERLRPEAFGHARPREVAERLRRSTIHRRPQLA